MELPRWDVRMEVNEREVRRGKFFRKKFSDKCRVTGKKLQRSDRWDKSLVEWAPLRQLITKLPLSHGWWVLKTRKMCFHFWSSSLNFLSDRITKTGWPKQSDDVQTKNFLWVPQILDDEWWKHNHITQNSLIQTTPKWLNWIIKPKLSLQPLIWSDWFLN